LSYGDEEERPAMTGSPGDGRSASMADRISRAFGSLWIEYTGKRPSEVRTEIRGNLVTCRLIDSVGAFGDLNPSD
jgi:hypothetical protein